MKNKWNVHISNVKSYRKLYYVWFKYKKRLNTCRDSKLQYTRRQSSRDYIQHYLFYGFYPIKQTFLSARIAKLTETFNHWSQIKLNVTTSARALLDTKVLKQKFFTSRSFAEILIHGSQKKQVKPQFYDSIQIGHIFQVKVKPMNSGDVPVCTKISATWRCPQFEGWVRIEKFYVILSFLFFLKRYVQAKRPAKEAAVIIEKTYMLPPYPANICWSSGRLQDVFSVTILRLPRRLEDVMWRRLGRRKIVALNTSSRRLEDMSWRRLENISWRRRQDVLEANKVFTGDICI